MKNKALILSPFFYPEPISTGKYNTYLVEELVRQGYDVDVWCSHPVYPSWSVVLSDAKLPGVNIYRGGGWIVYPKKAVLRRAILELWYSFFVIFNFIKIKKKYDVVIPVFPPSLFSLTFSLFKEKFKKVIGVVHDLQGVYAGRTGGFFSRSLHRLISWVERRSFGSCDHLIYLSEGMRIEANKAYDLDCRKSSVFYPFVTVDGFSGVNNLDHIFKHDSKNIVYSGALGEKQNGGALIELFQEVLAKSENCVAHIFSMGPVYDDLRSKFESERLKFHDLVDEKDLPELLARSSVQVVPQIQGSSAGSLPSKLPNLLASGCCVFCITDEGSELVDIIDHYSNGVVSTSWSIEENAEMIVSMLPNSDKKIINDELVDRFTKEALVRHISAEVVV